MAALGARAAAMACVLCMTLVTTQPAQAQAGRLAPIDDNASDLGWLNYRKRLVEALEARDRGALVAAIDPDVDNGP